MMNIDLSAGPVLIIPILFIGSLLVQLYYFLAVFLRLSIYRQNRTSYDSVPVSVVICAKNEEENLARFLPIILEQDYPEYEVVLVNDCSLDGSIDILKRLASQYRHLKVADIKEVEGREHGKKFALTIGIKAAKFETLLFTDADCYPTSKFWIKNMIGGYSAGKEIILGYGKYARYPGFLNRIIRFDTFFIAVQYLSMALKGNAYMGVGRNLSYLKGLFFKHKGFAAHMHLLSGDDDLFINEASDHGNTAIIVHKEAFTISEPKKTWRSWFLQKKRHHTTASYYKSSHKVALILYPLSWYLFYISFISGIITHNNLLILMIGLIIRTIIQITILQTSAKKLDEPGLGWISPILELIHRIFILPVYFLSTLFVKQRKWN